ncbi:MAG: hypothetical protein A3G18_00160 [Rhodospirillales bacterium RIFCSPLOWO2_12_FULL_58_28]|nr:MAG: hypothetical protein A3H92_02770 [Rhodospirillales bacterium RIFCSPLOWO2_02_FULL_58_16]OHC79881.1 MAG: hypothetical protein A3G18_00160 [Rhodospirillales bacterium RIFCSPLOWO2_12_FULL_58_28]
MNWTRYVFNFPALVVFLIPALFGCLGDDIKPLAEGVAAPKATLTLLNGETREVTDHPGRGQVVTFMSSWCPCSNDSIPMFKKAFKLHGENQRLAFLMIGIQDSRDKFAETVGKWDIPFPAGFDAGNKIARTYGVKQPPTTVFIDKDGKVKKFFYGNIKDVEEDFYKWLEGLV